MPSQSRNRRQQRRRSLKIKGGEEKDIMDKLVEIEGKIDGLNLIMQSNSTEEVPKEEEVLKEEEVPKEEEVHNEDAAGDLKTLTPESIDDDESNKKLETPEMPEIKSEMPENGSETESEMPEIKSETESEMPEIKSENDSEIKSEGGRRNSRRRRQRNNRKSQRRQQRR
jgi:hypothetical protein